MRRWILVVAAMLAALGAACGGSSVPLKADATFLPNGSYVSTAALGNLSTYVGSWDSGSGAFSVRVHGLVEGGTRPYSYDVTYLPGGTKKHFTDADFSLVIPVKPFVTPSVEISGSDNAGGKLRTVVRASEQAPKAPFNPTAPAVQINGIPRFNQKPCTVSLTAFSPGLPPDYTQVTWDVNDRDVPGPTLRANVAVNTQVRVYILDTNPANLGRPIGRLVKRIC